MRMTNKIMRNNSLYNINQNKILEDKLSNQMTNQSKITRPSDDPVVAIRALRLRTNVTTVSQYYDRNANDADKWLSLTSDALTTIDEILKDLQDKAAGGANKDFTASDLEIYLTQMKSLTKEFYSSGNVDYAGRYIFSGYRTDTPITFTAEDIKEMQKYRDDNDQTRNFPTYYRIQEKIGYSDISTISYTDYNVLSSGLPATAATDESYEQYVNNSTIYRMRLSYDALDDGTTLTIQDKYGRAIAPLDSTFVQGLPVENRGGVAYDRAANAPLGKDTNGNPVYANGNPVMDASGYMLNPDSTPVLDANDEPVPYKAAFMQFTEYDNAEDAYRAVANGTETGIAYIPSTGELVFSAQSYQELYQENDEFTISYNKSSWGEGDINPAHYFQCDEFRPYVDQTGALAYKQIAYNTVTKDQDIYYDVGFNQQIQVNTLATEVFTHDVRRDMDDFQHCLTQLQGIERTISDLEKKQAGYAEDSPEYQDLTKKIEGAKKAQTYIRENIHAKFENQITKYQNYMNDNNLAITNNATRGSRLDLITNRLMNQKATFKELQTDNEGIDVTQVAVELSSSELTYQAALMATSKIMQTNLMNYI